MCQFGPTTPPWTDRWLSLVRRLESFLYRPIGLSLTVEHRVCDGLQVDVTGGEAASCHTALARSMS